MSIAPQSSGRLLIQCPDQPGIIASVSNFLSSHQANITALDQYSTSPEGGTFFQRLEFTTPHMDLAWDAMVERFQVEVAQPFKMSVQFHQASVLPKIAIMVSKYDHVLMELLWRYQRHEIPAEIVMIISNHEDLRQAVAPFGIPFHVIPVTSATKPEAEAQAIALMESAKVDCVVLARYMQILSGDFISHFPHKIINIHHSFLPAFIGANPYQQAFSKGVKLIGATAHYVTQDLDMGPIIEQAVVRVAHDKDVNDLRILGQSVEREVLCRALVWHLNDRVIVHSDKTIVFA